MLFDPIIFASMFMGAIQNFGIMLYTPVLIYYNTMGILKDSTQKQKSNYIY